MTLFSFTPFPLQPKYHLNNRTSQLSLFSHCHCISLRLKNTLLSVIYQLCNAYIQTECQLFTFLQYHYTSLHNAYKSGKNKLLPSTFLNIFQGHFSTSRPHLTIATNLIRSITPTDSNQNVQQPLKVFHAENYCKG